MANPQVQPSDAIERELFICPRAHIYAVPPLASTSKGHVAAQWQRSDPIFTARVRITETSFPSADAGGSVAVTVVLEDPASGELFAAAPYTHPSNVAACADSRRYFAVRVVGDGGRKATLGVGFEERADAFDFGVVLQSAGRALGFSEATNGRNAKGEGRKGGVEETKRDLRLKEGEMVTVDIGGNTAKYTFQWTDTRAPHRENGGLIAPPPSAAASVAPVQTELDNEIMEGGNSLTPASNANNNDFDDDGEFGDFQ